jgi:hypothetical protein
MVKGVPARAAVLAGVAFANSTNFVHALAEPVRCLVLADARHLRTRRSASFSASGVKSPSELAINDVPHTLKQNRFQGLQRQHDVRPVLARTAIHDAKCALLPPARDLHRRAIYPADAPCAEALGLGHDRSGVDVR